MVRKVNYEFSASEIALTEKVVSRLEKRLLVDKEKQPGAELWYNNPTLIADVQRLLRRLRKRVSKISTKEIVVKLLKREIEHAITIHPEKWLKLLYGVTDTGMKKLHLKVSNGLK